MLEVAVATVPVLFLACGRRGQGSGTTVAIAGTLLGVYWIGLAFTHAELLRELPHGNGVVIDVLLGTFLGDTGAYLGGRLFGRRPLAPANLTQQDRARAWSAACWRRSSRCFSPGASRRG